MSSSRALAVKHQRAEEHLDKLGIGENFRQHRARRRSVVQRIKLVVIADAGDQFLEIIDLLGKGAGNFRF